MGSSAGPTFLCPSYQFIFPLFCLEMIIDILDKIEDIVHVIISPLLIDLVDEEVSSPVLVIHPVRDDDDHLLDFFGQDERIQSSPDPFIGHTGDRHIISPQQIEDRIISCFTFLISWRKVDYELHYGIVRHKIVPV